MVPLGCFHVDRPNLCETWSVAKDQPAIFTKDYLRPVDLDLAMHLGPAEQMYPPEGRLALKGHIYLQR